MGNTFQDLCDRLNKMNLSEHAKQAIANTDQYALVDLFEDCETEKEVEDVAREIIVTWYAVLMDKEDNDWGYGSYNLDTAKEMVRKNLDEHPEAYIAVIEEGSDPVCVDEIYQEDF